MATVLILIFFSFWPSVLVQLSIFDRHSNIIEIGRGENFADTDQIPIRSISAWFPKYRYDRFYTRLNQWNNGVVTFECHKTCVRVYKTLRRTCKSASSWLVRSFVALAQWSWCFGKIWVEKVYESITTNGTLGPWFLLEPCHILNGKIKQKTYRTHTRAYSFKSN